MTHTLLLADDEEGIRKVLGLALADSGYEVMTAENGLQALDVFRSRQPEIVLTDIKMPELDGIELLRLIKAERPETEVIMITGHGDMDLAVESLKLEATDFVTKPINDDALAIALKRAGERIAMRRELREHTDNLKRLVRKQAARLVEVERLAAVGQALKGISNAFKGMAGDLEGGTRWLNEMPCFVSVHNRDLTVVSANSLFEERLGASSGRRSWEAYPDRWDQPLTCPVARTVESGQGLRSQEVIRYRDGSRYLVMVHTVPIRNGRGELELVLEFAVDLSEVARLREALQSTQDRLAALGLMVSSVSHGIKGVLTGLDAGVYLIRSGLRKQDLSLAGDGLDTTLQMVERLRQVVLDVLYFAKERPLSWRPIDVRPFVERLIETAEPKARQHAIDLAAEWAGDLGQIEADETVLATALFNILENAVDACAQDRRRPAHRITVRVSGHRAHVEIEIADDGIGMPPPIQEKIFDMFYSSKGHAGTGLGLFIARQMIRQHGGTIQVESTEGVGSRFCVHLPRVLPAAEKERQPEAPPA
jgi:signal transduction histidine kinase/FixJ family two-component response regulator